MTEPRKPRVRSEKGTDPRLPQGALSITVQLYSDHAIARVVAAPTLNDLRTDRLLGAVRLDTGRAHLVGLSAPAAARVLAMSVARAMAEVDLRMSGTAAGSGVPLGTTGGSFPNTALPGLEPTL